MSKGRIGDVAENRKGPRGKRVDVVSRFNCSPEFLFRAWIDAEQFSQWWGPRGWQAYDCLLDPRVGGRWKSSFRRTGAPDIHIGGEYLEVDAPSRLVFSWNSYGTLVADDMSLVELTFVSLGSVTELRITHTKLTTGEAEDMDIGWVSALESLAAFVAACH